MKELKRIFTYILVFVLSFDIISFSYFNTIYASEWPEIEEESEGVFKQFLSHPLEFVKYVLYQTGCVLSGDIPSALDKQQDYKSKLDKWYQDGKIKVSSSSAVGGSGITIDASVTQEILDDMKQYASDNGGYTLVPTIKSSQISSAMFPSSNAYRAMLNLLSSSNGVVGVVIIDGEVYFYELPDFPYYFVKYSEVASGTGIYRYLAYSDFVNSYKTFDAHNLSSCKDGVPGSFDDLDGCSRFASNLYLGDYFNYQSPSARLKSSTYYYYVYVVTRSGLSVPVFNSIGDAINYSVQNGLYFVGSNYDGVGKDITITADDIQKIQDGYYDGMYEQLQKLIQENDVSPLDYEKLAELADQVLNSLGDIEQNTGESNTILQKILDVLNDMNGFLHTNMTGSSDIDLSALYSRLDSVVNELRSMSSALGNISSSSGGSFDVDVGGIEDRLDGMASQLAKEADTLESLNNAVDGTNSTLAELNSSISDLSSSLDEMYSALDGLKLDTDNTDVVNKLNEVQEQIQLTNSRLDDVYDVIHRYLPLMSDILQELKDIYKAQVGSGFSDAALGVLQGLLDGLGGILGDIVIDPEVNIKKSFDDFSNAYKDTGAVEMLKKKFPFSIPWDMAFLVAFLSAPPEAPRFEFPLVFERLGINEVIVLDFSDFEVVSKISRTLLTLIYLIALMKFTTNIITKE